MPFVLILGIAVLIIVIFVIFVPKLGQTSDTQKNYWDKLYQDNGIVPQEDCEKDHQEIINEKTSVNGLIPFSENFEEALAAWYQMFECDTADDDTIEEYKEMILMRASDEIEDEIGALDTITPAKDIDLEAADSIIMIYDTIIKYEEFVTDGIFDESDDSEHILLSTQLSYLTFGDYYYEELGKYTVGDQQYMNRLESAEESYDKCYEMTPIEGYVLQLLPENCPTDFCKVCLEKKIVIDNLTAQALQATG